VNRWIYDIEVFAHDWLVVFRRVDDDHHHIIHNNNYQLREFFMAHSGDVFGGFNNRHYDDWVVLTMLSGGDNATVKAHNDFIIEQGGNGWEFPFIRGQRKQFRSFDLRDDLPIGLSLKAIEANMGLNIVESSVDFTIDRPLTRDELKETIRYCCNDVDATLKLYETRKAYLDSKTAVGSMKGIDEATALSLTNAKLTAAFVDAKAQYHDDEFEYKPPRELRIKKYKEVLNFFKVIDYDQKLKINIAGVPHVYAWGGLHGAIPNYFQRSDDETVIMIADVGSYYPSMIIQYGFASRNSPDADAYKDVYVKRMAAKRNGDKVTANSLKLVLNTYYGATKNQYNDLYDPRMANAICITGQLFLTDLIEKLELIKGFELIQSNTDGIIIRYPKKVDQQIRDTIGEWEQRTRLTMELGEVRAIAQKDVNNYIMEDGDGHIKSKGGYVSLYDGGDFKMNSLQIVHRAIGDYFLHGTPVEDTINACEDIHAFQIIAKAGGTYTGVVWERSDQTIPVQRVNRVYACTNPDFGTLYKIKEDGRRDKIASLPDCCLIDNDNRIHIDEIDRQWYIELAKKRVQDYLGAEKAPKIKKTKKNKEDIIMAVKATIDPSTMNIYRKLMEAREKFLAMPVKKSGINRFAKFEYFELADIVPVKTAIFRELGLCDMITFGDDDAVLMLYNVDDPEADPIVFRTPIKTQAVNGMNEMQAIGASETYARRYLYQLVLDIVEADTFDATMAQEGSAPVKLNKSAAPTETAQKGREEAKKALTSGNASESEISAVKRALAKLRDKDEARYTPYIAECLKKLKGEIGKKAAEDLLVEIGEKIEEE
jgi:hypothetical protein